MVAGAHQQPRHCHRQEQKSQNRSLPRATEGTWKESRTARRERSKRWWLRPQTTHIPSDLNDLNKEDASHYVRLSVQCVQPLSSNILNSCRRLFHHATTLLTSISHCTLLAATLSLGMLSWRTPTSVWHAIHSLMPAIRLF